MIQRVLPLFDFLVITCSQLGQLGQNYFADRSSATDLPCVPKTNPLKIGCYFRGCSVLIYAVLCFGKTSLVQIPKPTATWAAAGRSGCSSEAGRPPMLFSTKQRQKWFHQLK